MTAASQHVIAPLNDVRLADQIQRSLDNKTKPIGSLGRLESLAHQLAMILGTPVPQLDQPQLVVFAADHGLAVHGVSAFPSEVTWQMVENFLSGGAAVSVLARQHGITMTIVDCGIAKDLAARPGLKIAKVRAGTADTSTGPAMTRSECDQALANGASLVDALPGNALLLGEMGIGNTSAASLLMARLTGLPLAECVGRGTGLDDAGLARKLAILTLALTANPANDDPLETLSALGGLEIATMTGAVLRAAASGRVIVVDGFICTAAVALANALAPEVLSRCVFAHCSAESGHERWLAQLKAQPLLDLGLRLGEGSGAALAWPLLVSASRLLTEMASFNSAGVSQRQS